MKCDHNNKVTTSIITESNKSMFPNHGQHMAKKTDTFCFSNSDDTLTRV